MWSKDNRTVPRPRSPQRSSTTALSTGRDPDQPASTEPRRSKAGARTLLFLALLLFCNLQGDGLPLGGATPLDYQLRLLPFTLLFLALLLIQLFPNRTAAHLPQALTRPFLGWRGPIACATILLLLALPLFLAEASRYARFGYHISPTHTVVIVLLSAAILLTLLGRPTPAANRLTVVVLAITSALNLLSLRSFPLAVQRSDMLPLLAAANRTLLTHHNPYRLYTFPTESVQLTYLPGTLLAYLPATLLHLDLRLTNLAALILLTILTVAFTRPSHRPRTAALLATFLFGPYLLYRHELYTPPLWLALAAALLLAHARHTRLAAVIFGVCVAMSQFSWILLPFFLLFLLETEDRRTALQSLFLALLTAAAITAPFLLADPHAFLSGTFGHWGQIGLTARPVNLSFFLAALIGPSHLQLAQLSVLAVLFLAAVRTHACRTFAGTLRVMAIALAAFILLNLLVWGYFFLLLEVILLLHLLAAEDLLRHPLPSVSASHEKT